jgi:uridylate kinase
MGSTYTDKVVISLGGSLIVPQEGIDTKFLTDLNEFVRNELAANVARQFFLVAGGGQTARHYIIAAQDVIGHKLTRDDLDWLGIHSSRLNAHLVRTIFRDIAHPYIIKHYEIIRKVTEPVVVAAAWKPGWSTDYDAVLLCEDYGMTTVINLSNVDQVYDKDPKKFEDAKPLDKISWAEFRAMVGDEWIPGMNAPFDPIASQKAEELGIKVVVMNGKNLENLDKFLKGEQFVGTTIG